jgi:hypothetical protein
MSNTEATRKQLKIKAGVVKRFVCDSFDTRLISRYSLFTIPIFASTTETRRYQKEIELYSKEVVENKKRLESVTAAAGEESWDVRNVVCDATIS